MKHLDLFSGIGTWALASQEVWPDREMVGFAEIDPFACAVLQKHFPDVRNYGDIIALADALCGVEQEQQGSSIASGRSTSETRDRAGIGTGDRIGDGDTPKGVRGLESSSDKLSKTGYADTNTLYDLDLLTASPPCQAASTAGKRKGTDDARWLWPATLRIVASLRPKYFILENVAGLLSLNGGVEFDKVLVELEAKGYEVQPFLIPAAAAGAPHRRDRVWIVGHRIGDDPNPISLGRGGRTKDRTEVSGSQVSEVESSGHGSEPVADAEGEQDRRIQPTRLQTNIGTSSQQGVASNAPNQRPEQPRSSRSRGTRLADRSEWNQDWRTAAERTCREIQAESGVWTLDDGSADGLSRLPRNRRLPDGTIISQSKWRRESLKAIGNGIVGQVAVEIMRAIKSSSKPERE